LTTFKVQINFKFTLNSQLPPIQTSYNIFNKLLIYPFVTPTSVMSTVEIRCTQDSTFSVLDYKNKPPALEHHICKCKERTSNNHSFHVLMKQQDSVFSQWSYSDLHSWERNQISSPVSHTFYKRKTKRYANRNKSGLHFKKQN